MIILFLAAAAAQLDCNNAATQQDMNVCAAREFQAADAKMSRQWKITSADMKQRDRDFRPGGDKRPGYFAQLLKAQRAWLSYRDAHCQSAAYEARGGSMERMLYSGCRTALTEERAKQLYELSKRN